MWTPPRHHCSRRHRASRTSFIDPAGWRVPIGRARGRSRPGHTYPPPRHPLHVARRHHARYRGRSQGLLMFLGRRRVYTMHTYIIRNGGGGVYTPNTCYKLLWRFSENGLFGFFIRHPVILAHTPLRGHRTDAQVLFKKVINMHNYNIVRIGKIIIYCYWVTFALNSMVNDYVHPLHRCARCIILCCR